MNITTINVLQGNKIYSGMISWIAERDGRLYNVKKFDKLDKTTQEQIKFMNGNLTFNDESIKYAIDVYCESKNDFLAKVLSKVSYELRFNNPFYIQDKWIIDYIDKKLSN